MRPWIVLVVCSFALAGCSSNDDPDDSTPDPSDPVTDPGTGIMEPESPRDPVTWDVSIAGNDFVDGSLTIQVGDTVRWTHQDGPVPHTVTADDGSFDSDNGVTNRMTEAANTVYQFTFDAEGEFPYVCEVHSSMTDSITVLERYDGVPE